MKYGMHWSLNVKGWTSAKFRALLTRISCRRRWRTVLLNHIWDGWGLWVHFGTDAEGIVLLGFFFSLPPISFSLTQPSLSSFHLSLVLLVLPFFFITILLLLLELEVQSKAMLSRQRNTMLGKMERYYLFVLHCVKDLLHSFIYCE